MIRAWRALPGFEGRSTLRAWLYKIATNAALDVAKRRYRRELPVSYGPPTTAGGGPGAPLAETTWIEPYQLGTSVPAVTSAPQRAREGVRRRNGEPAQQQALRALGDKRVRRLVEAFVDALERADVGSLADLLTEDATWAMTPARPWSSTIRSSAAS